MQRDEPSNPYESPEAEAGKSPPKYRTAPAAIRTLPPGIPYIVGNEAAERFSFYGMKAILAIFMTKFLVDASGASATMDEPDARFWIHIFVFATYFFSIAGAILADAWLGKYRTIISLSIVYCLGHLALALDETHLGLALGLGLIAVGAGGIKPCVSAHVGDQFGKENEHLLSRVFGWFYFSINLGAFVSTILTPILLRSHGPSVAFGLPGVLMLLATIIFWLGRNKFVHIPPGGIAFLREASSDEGKRVMLRLAGLYLFIAVFWALYDQSASAWVLQADKMNLGQVLMPTFPAWPRPFPMEFTWQPLLPDQVQAINPILILVFVPLFAYVIYPLINRVFPLTPLRKISMGLFLAAAAFAISAVIEQRIVDGREPYIVWQAWAYVVLTAGEVMVSITALEFSYTQAPKKMKSLVMALYLLSVAVGNLFTAGVNLVIKNSDGSSKLPGASYYWFFVWVMLPTAVLFIFYARLYRGQTYIQDEA